MCGLVGLLAGRQPKRRLKDIEALTDIFTMLLLLSEHRGPHATGAAWVKSDGTFRVEKAPLAARHFIQTPCYADFLNEAGHDITLLMGHTRWPTRGSVDNPANNHPILLPIHAPTTNGRYAPGNAGGHPAIGQLALCHNGHVPAVSHHFRRLCLPRSAEVDSELLACLAQRHAGADGLDIPAFLTDLEPLDGRMSLALVTTTRPEDIILLKGNMPLEVRIQPRTRVLLYASEARILDRALTGESGWETLPLAHGEGLVVNTDTWTLRRVPFTFQGLTTMAGNSYTGAITRRERSS